MTGRARSEGWRAKVEVARRRVERKMVVRIAMVEEIRGGSELSLRSVI